MRRSQMLAGTVCSGLGSLGRGVAALHRAGAPFGWSLEAVRRAAPQHANAPGEVEALALSTRQVDAAQAGLGCWV
jgi:hypothetical protein